MSAPALIHAGGGPVIIIGSGMARVTAGGSDVSAVAKAGACALTQVLAAELREPDIAVNELIPGPARTPGMGGGGEHDREIEQRWWDLGEWFTDPERSRGSRLSSPPCLRGGRPARCSALLGGSCNRLGPGLCDLLLEPPGEPSPVAFLQVGAHPVRSLRPGRRRLARPATPR